jgi:hypothetical protein
MASSGLAELESQSDCVGGYVEGRHHIVGRKLSQFIFDSVIVKIVETHRFKVKFLFDEVYLQIVHFVFSLQHPLNVIDVNLQLFSNAVDISMLELDVWSSKALETPVGLQQIWFELFTEINHVSTQRVKIVLLVGDDFGEYLLALLKNLIENLDLLVEETIRIQFKYLRYER